MTDRDTTIEHTFGAVVRRVRNGMGLNQTQLAQRLTAAGVPLTQQQVAKVETAGRPIRLNEAAAIAGALGVSLALMLRMETPTRLDEAREELARRTRDLERARAEEADAARAIEHLGVVADQLDARRRQAEVAAFLEESSVESLREEIEHLAEGDEDAPDTSDDETPPAKPTKRTRRVSPRPPARIAEPKTKTRNGERSGEHR